MRFNSLSLRLTVTAAVWSAIALLIAGVILTTLYRQSVERAFDERLNVYMQTLIGALANQRPSPLSDPGNLGEQRFEQLFSGWYWQVRNGRSGQVALASRSLFTEVLDVPGATLRVGPEGVRRATLEGPNDQFLRAVARNITFEEDGPENDRPVFEVLVAGNASELREETAIFRTQVALTLGLFGLGLVVSTLGLVRFGLRPLDQVRRGLADLRSGKEHRFEGPFPAEIEPLARELNALIKSNREILERARTQVGNLAHALKTPLSVITNEARASQGPLAEKVSEQAEVMRVQVNHYLDRARIAARSEVIGSLTEVAPVLDRLVRTMARIHGERGLAIGPAPATAAKFRGEQQDLEEIAGNLLDNACKWARSRVVLEVAYDAPTSDASTGRLAIVIHDDGPGMSEEQCAEAMRRGRRLDESKPGSGLGLSIVADLVAMYAGTFRLHRGPLGGLCARVELPAA